MEIVAVAWTLVLVSLAGNPAVAAPTGCTDESTAGAAGFYVRDGELWQESNGKAGLQRGPGIDEYGRDRPGDTRIAGAPSPSPPFPYGCYHAPDEARVCVFQGNACFYTWYTMPTCLF